MNTKEIIEEITSRDTHKVWSASCRIISESQNREEINPLIPYLSEIKKKTKGLNMGGVFAANQRFVDFAIKVIEFHRDSGACPCALYLEHGVDPNKEVVKGNVKINETVRIDGKWVDYYTVSCEKCLEEYKVIEREGHYMWWEWTNA